MIKVNFYDLGTIDDCKLDFAVIMAKYLHKWIYVKSRKRMTWEIPGGHRENGEDINNTASRELFEETGAIKFNLTPICIYSVERDKRVEYTESFGQLFLADVELLDKLPEFEVQEIKLFDSIPSELTYPLIQPQLHNKVVEFIINKNKLV